MNPRRQIIEVTDIDSLECEEGDQNWSPCSLEMTPVIRAAEIYGSQLKALGVLETLPALERTVRRLKGLKVSHPALNSIIKDTENDITQLKEKFRKGYDI